MPALGAFRIHEKSEAVVVREGVVLGSGFGVSDRGLGESHRTRHEKTDLPSTGLMYWKMCPLGLDLSVFRGDAAKVKERLFFGRKKWTSFQRSIF